MDKVLYTGLFSGIIAVLGNIIFYLLVKGRVDKSIERHKIAYSGVFKEKIDIYRETLSYIVDIEFKINQYRYHGSNQNFDLENEIKNLINAFIKHTLINKPFFTDSLIENIQKVKAKHSEIFDSQFRYTFLINKVDGEQLHQYFVEALKSFKELESVEFIQLKNAIVYEIKKEMNP